MSPKTSRLGIVVSALFLTCCDNPVLEVATRAGHTFTLAEPSVSYTRICNPGTIPQHMTDNGLLVDNPDFPNSPLNETIAWSRIESIEFSGRIGELGRFCSGLPRALQAQVRFRNGDRAARNLTDTTHGGLFGVLKRDEAVAGTVQVALRDVSQIRVSFSRSWAPQKKMAADLCGTVRGYPNLRVRVTKRTGDIVALVSAKSSLANPAMYVRSGHDRLVHPFMHDTTACGMLVLIGDARHGIPWDLLRVVEFSSPDDKQHPSVSLRAVHLTFADQRTEKASVRGGGIEGSLHRDSGGCTVPTRTSHSAMCIASKSLPEPNERQPSLKP